jgi:5,10-methylenetetrahydromethanopterin reductase
MSHADLSLLLVGRYPAPEFRGLAELAEEAGYDGLWHADERFFRDCWAGLTVAALSTSRIRLGICVTDPYVRHPALTATAFATVDEISGGRTVLGLGAGISGFKEMGIQRVRPRVALRETIELVRRLWTGERVDYSGEVVQFHDGAIQVPARGDAPICIASNGPSTIELAGEVADGLIVQALASPFMVDSVRTLLSNGAERAGRDMSAIRLHARVDVAVHADREAARNAVLPGVTRHLRTHYPHFNSPRLAGVEIPEELAEALAAVGYTHDQAALADLARLVPEQAVDRLAIAGTAEEVAGQIAALLRTEVAEVMVMPVLVPGQDEHNVIRQIAEEVMPRARQLAGTSPVARA